MPLASSSPDVGPVLDFLRLLWRVNHRMERRSKLMHATLGITAPQRMVVRIVGRFPSISASEIAGLLHVDRGTLSAALARLESAGIITRLADPKDKRRVRVKLTARGEALDRETRGTVESAVAAVLDQESTVDVRRTRRVLTALADALERDPVPPTPGVRATASRTTGRAGRGPALSPAAAAAVPGPGRRSPSRRA